MSDLKPTLIVISNGSHGSCHHPRQATLDTYSGLTPAPVVLQTNRCKLASPCGNVGPALIADPEMSGKNGTIQIVVDAVSRSYEVKYGASTIRTYRVQGDRHGSCGRAFFGVDRSNPEPVAEPCWRRRAIGRGDDPQYRIGRACARWLEAA